MNFRIKSEMKNAPAFLDWLKTRGGIAIWKSIDLSRAGQECLAPVNDAAGNKKQKPHWMYANEPAEIVTDPAMIAITVDKEVKRFHAALRVSGNGMSLKCTDASSERVRKAVDKAGEGAYYVFDHETQDAVIMKPEPDSEISLVEWEKNQGAACER